MHRYRHLMVGLTRTDADAGLIRYAARIAGLGTVNTVRFVHVLPESATEDHDRVCEELLALIRPMFAGVPSSVPLACDVLHGPLVDRFLEHVADKQADLLLVGDRGKQDGRRRLARRLAMKAPCSVWLVPDGSPPELRRILVPIDFSESAADCIRVATSMARLSGQAEVLALHVYFNEATVTFEGYDQVIRGEESEEFNRFVAPIDRQGVTVTPIFEESANVAHAIGRAAEKHKADLIVMGTRGRSRSAAILLGSVTEEMIEETRLPLLAVKHFGARMSVLQALLDRRFWQQGELHT
jgi:nucleotide-binding universal stress UspA family protein